MGNVVEFKKKQDKSTPSKEVSEVISLTGNGGFTDEVKLDINVLCNALNLESAEQAIEVARSFYRKYPALMEWVSSPDVSIYKGNNILDLLLNYKL